MAECGGFLSFGALRLIEAATSSGILSPYLVRNLMALSILVGLSLLGWSLLGGVFFLLSPDRVSRKELTTFQEAVEREIDAGS